MSTIKITTPPAPIIEVKGEGKYHLVLPLPKPVVVEVKGLFASTFVDSVQTTDLLLNYQIAKL
jgi:hypothetical protein